MGSIVRRIISIVLIAGLVVAIIYGLIWLRLNNTVVVDSHKAVPPGFVFCLEMTDYSRMTSALQNHSNIWREYQAYPTIEKLNSILLEIDSLKRNSEDIKKLLQNEVLISAYPADTGNEFLFILRCSDRSATDQVLKLISADTDINKEKYENVTIYDLKFSENIPGYLTFTETRGLFIMSTSRDLLKNATIHLNSGENIFTSSRYRNINATLGSDVEAHLYINFEELSTLASQFIKEAHVPELSGFSSAAALDVEIKPDQLLFNGFSSLNDSVSQKLSLLAGQDPVEQGLFDVIPSSVVYFKWLGISDQQKFLNLLKEYDPRNPEVDKLRDIFYSSFSGQASEIILRKSMKSFSKLLLVSLKSQGQVENKFKELFIRLNSGRDLTEQTMNIDENFSVMAHELPSVSIEKYLFADLFPETGYKWYCFYNNHLVLAKSVSDLKEYCYLNSLGKTLSNDDYFEGLKNNFSSRSNLFIYFDPSQYYNEILEILKPDAQSVLEKNIESWKKLNVIGFQSTVAEELNYFRLFVNYTGKIREYVNTVWERKLEANLSMKPEVVLNHNNNEKEIFVQDEENFIYLINNSGGIIWKQQIDGQILGNIYQLDYYGNGKLQYLFNTENRIHLIDRNGNNVDKYPVNLREKASAGLALFDYDNNRDFRIPVPTVDRDILMYDKEGDIVSGWRFRRADHIISFPLEHYRIGDKDYIVARDDFNLYILNRRGRTRVRPSEQIDFSLNNPVEFLPASGGKSERIVATDINGHVYAFYFDGSVEKIMEQNMSEDHYFMPADIDGNGAIEFIYLDSTRLNVFNQSSDLIFSEVYPEEISLPPVLYSFSSVDKKIGIVAGESERIYLMNNDGSIYQGFPLQGSSLFSISSFPGLKDRFNLLVGNNDNFLYNYSVK